METHPVTRSGHAVSELLEDSGNRRQIINQELSLHLLSDSPFSEQQKLRYVLDWTHSFLSSGSEIHHELSRADGLILADEAHRETQKISPELKVTSCTGPGLHGDQLLALIGRRCDRVTGVDVSWSGATDTGVKALSDGRSELQLKSVVLNGCHVTDDPLTKLIMRHKDSLCRLEVFGCQFLTPSCLQTVFEMCPRLEHLNIGQVPKVNTHSLTVMTSQLKCLISLNLTGLQAVTDATVDTLLQNCVRLQSLTLSSCPGVTDLTLHSISKYAPYIRSFDVSGCKAVTDAGVRSLALGCGRLEQLDLSSTGTGNRGVTLLANYCSGHLHTVKLSFCHITRENILKLCRRCKRLKVLHLYGWTRLPTEREIRGVNTAVKVYPLP
ncbi:uncharacterized protein [Pagrus major]|uniref:uncharacterized protein n=1 Tax=Pagrus major TaxID=143350 RepID=UPI003CC83D9B